MIKLPENFELDRYGLHVRFVREEGEILILGFKEFCVRGANSRGALTPSNIHRILLGAPQSLHVSVSNVSRI